MFCLLSYQCQSTSLARESLLSLTSQRTGEWFKEEMRNLGGLDYIVDLGKGYPIIYRVYNLYKLVCPEETKKLSQ